MAWPGGVGIRIEERDSISRKFRQRRAVSFGGDDSMQVVCAVSPLWKQSADLIMVED